MSELTIKQMQDVAVKKELEVPDEAGYVFYEASGTLVTEDEFGAKAVKVCPPSDKQMEIINNQCLEPQDKENWMIIKGINPLGIAAEPDAHSDVFSKAAERDMAKQAFWTPVIINHMHEMNPPIGRCLEATAGKEGLRETWAIPKASYNAEYREAILHGNMPEISVGAFIEGKDKLCNSCGDGKSIYSVDCPHIPGRPDPKTGQKTTVTINRVQRYVERSLVNIPARLGTSVKSLAPDQENPALKETLEEIDEELKALNDSVFEKGGLEGLTSPVSLTQEEIKEAFHKALRDAFSDDGAKTSAEDGLGATINPVINTEEDPVAEKDVKAPEAQEPSEKEEIIAPEAPAAEEKAEAPEPQEVTIEVPVVKALEVEELTKAYKAEVESITKALDEKHAQLLELQEKNAKDLGALTETVTKIAQHIVELAQFSSEDAINQVIELVSQLKDQKAVEPVNKAPDNFTDFVTGLVSKK